MKQKRAHLWDRQPEEWYVEPERATIALLNKERFTGAILDPACGGGNIVKTCQQFGYAATGRDLIKRTDAKWFGGTSDFLADRNPSTADNIITNPPYYKASGTEGFIRRSLELAKSKVAIFADIRFLAGADRASGVFAEHPPQRIWIVTPRVSCPPGTFLAAGNKASNGSSDYVWLVWDIGSQEPTRLDWLRREDGEAGIFG